MLFQHSVPSDACGAPDGLCRLHRACGGETGLYEVHRCVLGRSTQPGLLNHDAETVVSLRPYDAETVVSLRPYDTETVVSLRPLVLFLVTKIFPK